MVIDGLIRFLLLFIFYQSFREDIYSSEDNRIKLYLSKSQRANLNKDAQLNKVTLKYNERRISQWDQHFQKNDNAYIIPPLLFLKNKLNEFIQSDTGSIIEIAQFALEIQFIALKKIVFNEIDDYNKEILSLLMRERVYNHDNLMLYHDRVREFLEIDNEVIAARKTFLDNTYRHSNKHQMTYSSLNPLCKELAIFVNHFVRVVNKLDQFGLDQSGWLWIGSLDQFESYSSDHRSHVGLNIEVLLNEIVKNSYLNLQELTVKSPLSVLNQYNLDSNQLQRYLIAIAKLVYKYKEITKIMPQLDENYVIYEVGECTLFWFLYFAAIYFFVKYFKKATGSKSKDEEKNVKKTNGKRIEKYNNSQSESCSTIIDWLDSIPDLWKLPKNINTYIVEKKKLLEKEKLDIQFIEKEITLEKENLEKELIEKKIALEKEKLEKYFIKKHIALEKQLEKQFIEQQIALEKQLEKRFIEKQIESISSSLECPVCMEVASSPIYQCIASHLICSRCLPRISSCPECRQKYWNPPQRNRYAEIDANRLVILVKEKQTIVKKCFSKY